MAANLQNYEKGCAYENRAIQTFTAITLAVFFFVMVNLATKTPGQKPSDHPALNYFVVALAWLACMGMTGKFGESINPALSMAQFVLFVS